MKQFLRVSRYIFSFYMRYKKGFFTYLFFLAIAGVLSNIEPLLYKQFVDILTKNGTKNVTLLFEIIAAIAILRLLAGALVEVVFYIWDRSFYLKSEFDMMSEVFSHIQKLSFDFHQNKKSGTLISAINRGRSAYFSYAVNIAFNLIYFMIGLIFLIATLGFISPKIMIVVIVTIAVYIFFSAILLKENISKRGIANEADDEVKAKIADNMINYETVKFYRNEEYEKDQIVSEKQYWFLAQYGYTKTFRFFGIMYTIVTAASIFVALFISLQDLIAGRISIGSFVLIITFITSLFQRLADLFFQFREVAKNFADLESYIGLTQIPVEIVDPANPVDLPENINGEVKFNNVSFAYKGRNNVLNDVSFAAMPNTTTALVGRSGAGKSTISKLLLRLYDVTGGSITIDGIDIRDLRQEDLGKMIGIVPQEPTLFNNSIKYNIGYAKPGISMEMVRQAVKAAFLDDFISSLPEGYDTEVGERGIKLSGGQKQRLAIARTLIQDPKIIVFDEATSHLDSESEHAIQKALETIARDKTVIVIAHRLSTIMHANKILVFEDGQLVDSGTHDGLIQNSSELYHKLWMLQTAGEL